MKPIFTGVMLFACIIIASAQTQTAVEQLRQTYREQVSWSDAGELTYDAATKTLAVKNYRIPVTDNTLIRVEKRSVHFAMQNYTAVTDVNDSTWRRAEFIIPFKSKKSAADFITYLEKIKKG